MAWKLIGEKQLATVEIPGAGVSPVSPVPGTTPAPGQSISISEFVTQHRLLKNLIEKAGNQRQCVQVDKIARDSGLSVNDVDRHLRLFEIDNYATKINKDVVCSVEAINELRSALKKKRRMG